jgi:hypothetical protein
MLSLLFFVAGSLVGWFVGRSGETIQRLWPTVLRTQIFITAMVLTGVAVWRVRSIGELKVPLLLCGALLLPFLGALVTRKNQSTGELALEAWAVAPNSGYWVIPVATAFGGAPAALVAALVNVLNTAVNSWWVAFLRRDAPRPQRRATSWADYSPLIATVIGLLLHLLHSAPSATKEVLTWAGPLLAFSGAALVAGSILHPHNLAISSTRQSLWRWAWLTGIRVAFCLVILTTVSSKALRIVVVLTALSAPAFNPVQLAVLYGYRSSVVNTAIRWGWALVPLGLLGAALLRT